MTLLSSDRRMVPRDMPRPPGVTVIGCVFLGVGVYPVLHRNDYAGCAEGALDLESVTIAVFNQTHEALCALGDGAHLDCRHLGALAVAELGPLHPARMLGIGVAFGSAYICALRPRLDMADARLRPRHYLESLDYFVPHETVYPGRIPN